MKRSPGLCRSSTGLLVFVLLHTTAFAPLLFAQTEQVVRVGVYNNPPKIYIEADGTVGGFHAELIKEIGRKNGWSIEFVQGTWNELLNMTEAGEVDVMVDVALSSERLRRFSFNDETVFVNWAVIYSRRGFQPQSFVDLDGARVAAMENGIHTVGESGIVSLARAFDLDIELILVPDYRSAFELIDRGEADVAVVNRIFGGTFVDDFDIERTSVIFNPISIRYALPKNDDRTPILIRQIDTTLRTLKKDNNGLYYRLLDRYMAGYIEERTVVPIWLIVLLGGISALVFVLAGLILKLRAVIARRREMEESLKEAKQEADAANRAKSAFLANMTHEIRTPMNAIIGYSELLQHDTTITDKQRRNLEAINHSGEHLLTLINEILDMSRIEAGKLTIDDGAFRFTDTMYRVKTFFRPLAQAQDVVIDLSIDENVPIGMRSDEQKIRQIVINLVGNAIKHAETPRVLIRGSLAENASDRCIVTVQDFGRGIAPEHREKIFAAFEQAVERGPGTGGTGLGLAISRSYARLLGGDLWLSESSESGSTFAFTFTFAPESDAPAPRTEDNRRAVAVEALYLPVKVLVVDDRDTNREILKELLEPLGFSLRYAHDGDQGVKTVRRWRPDLVLMDIVMPRMGGVEAVTEIRRENHSAKIIALTASADVEDKHEILDAGADAFLYKPYRGNELLEKIAELLSIKYAYREAPSPPRPTDAAFGGDDGVLDPKTPSKTILEALYHAAQMGSRTDFVAEVEKQSVPDDFKERLLRLAEDYRFSDIRDLLDGFIQNAEVR